MGWGPVASVVRPNAFRWTQPPGAAPSAASSSNQGGEDRHHSKQDGAGFAAAGRGDFEVEEVENGEALERVAARDRVVAGLVAAGTARSLRDVQRAAQTGAVELVG